MFYLRRLFKCIYDTVIIKREFSVYLLNVKMKSESIIVIFIHTLYVFSIFLLISFIYYFFSIEHIRKIIVLSCNIFVQSCFVDKKKKSNVAKMKVIYLMLRTQRHNGDMMRNVYLYDF